MSDFNFLLYTFFPFYSGLSYFSFTDLTFLLGKANYL